MSDLISRSALIRRFAYYHAHSYGKAEYAYGVATEEVVKAPAIDAVPVVHASWAKDTYNGRTCCSSCKVDLPGVWYYNGEDEDENYEEIDSTPYCPNCGAKMDGGDSNG